MRTILFILLFSLPVYGVEIEISPEQQDQVNTMVRRAFDSGAQTVVIKLTGGTYKFNDSWFFFSPRGTVIIDSTQAKTPVTFAHHVKFSSMGRGTGQYRTNRACIYALCRTFVIRGKMEFDWNYPKWIQYGRFINLSCPLWVAKNYLRPSSYRDFVVTRNRQEFIEVPFELVSIGTADSDIRLVDRGPVSGKTKHRESENTAGTRLDDRWFVVANHDAGGGQFIVQNVTIESDGTEVCGGMGEFKQIRFINNAFFGERTTTGAAFGALFRRGDKSINIDLFEVSNCYSARERTRFAALGYDSQDAVDVICKKVIIKDNVVVCDPDHAHRFIVFTRIKTRSHVPDIELINNTLVFNRNKNPRVNPRLLSVERNPDGRKGNVVETGTIITGERSLKKFQKWSGAENYRVQQ